MKTREVKRLQQSNSMSIALIKYTFYLDISKR